MADNAHKYGFRYYGSLNGSSCPKTIEYVVVNNTDWTDGATSVDLSVGDVVKLTNAGRVTLADAGDAELMFGIVAYCKYWNGTQYQPSNRIPNQTDSGSLEPREARAGIIPLAGNIWAIDHINGANTTLAAYRLLIGTNADHDHTADTTDASKPKADPKLDLGTVGTVDGTWRILDVSKAVKNKDFTGANVELLVTVNEGRLPQYTATGI